jgi:hypothetical protein
MGHLPLLLLLGAWVDWGWRRMTDVARAQLERWQDRNGAIARAHWSGSKITQTIELNARC